MTIYLVLLFIAVLLWVVWARHGDGDIEHPAFVVAVILSVVLLILGAAAPMREEVLEKTDKILKVEWDGKKYEGVDPKTLSKVGAFHTTAVQWQKYSLFGIRVYQTWTYE
jgi:hypothetical protein